MDDGQLRLAQIQAKHRLRILANAIEDAASKIGQNREERDTTCRITLLICSHHHFKNNSMETETSHDLLAWRLAAILQKLNQGERLNIQQLAEEFNVSKRTIQRDLNDRFAFLPWEGPEGVYALDPAFLGCLSFKDIERFASLAGLQGLFPALDKPFFRELFDSQFEDTLSVHGPSYEDVQRRKNDFRSLQGAISDHRIVSFLYTKDTGTKTVEVMPYRLINNSGVWYLAGVNEGKPKSYAFGKISLLSVTEDSFTPDPATQKMLTEEDSIWLNEKKTEAVLTVAPPAAIYFRRRNLIPQQVIEKEMEDGGLIISGKFAHQNQILPIVRYWLPHVRIVSPSAWQDELDSGLKDYINSRGV